MAPVSGAPGEAEDADLLAEAVAHHFGRDLSAGHERGAGAKDVAVAGDQDPIEDDGCPGLLGEQGDLHRGPRFGAELPAAGGENRIAHRRREPKGPSRLGQATAYCSVTSRPAGLDIMRNSSRRIIGSSRISSVKPVCFSSCRRKLGSFSTRYSATSGCRRTAS